MKKRLICAGLSVLLVLSGISAFAADTVTTEYTKTENGYHHFTTSGKLDNANTAFVTVVVTDRDNITIDSIQYVDQGLTDGNGNFAFTNYIPKQNPVIGQEYTVRVGVWGRKTPITCDPLKLPADAPAYSLSGQFNFEGSRTLGTVELYKDGVLLDSMERAAGAYDFSMLEPGTYTVKFTKQSHLPEVREAEITTAHATDVDANLVAGDVNADAIINLSDFGEVTALLGQEAGSAQQKKADFLENGRIDVNELTKLIQNYGEDRRSE
ncbi:MAG: hypothetical protein IJE10_03545 [Clostridia bacterium]|nr:hypothetical protein [Clostridia bacterium]